MVKTHLHKPPWRNWRFLLFVTATVAWFGLLAGAAFPAWRSAMRKASEVDNLESRINHLNRWTVAGVWIEKDLRDRGSEIEAEFQRLFPPRHDRATLFLQLARIAEESGVTDLDLATVSIHERDARDLVDAMPATDAEMMDSARASDARASDHPNLQPYRLRARFAADIRRTAAFLRAVDNIDRAITIHRVAARPVATGIAVEMELDVYVNEQI